jgi:hypothetical protein
MFHIDVCVDERETMKNAQGNNEQGRAGSAWCSVLMFVSMRGKQ